MNKAFLDPSKPLITCNAVHCEGCPAGDVVTCHFNGSQLTHFFAIAVPPFLIGGAGVAAVNPWWLIPWLVFLVSYFGLIEIRVMCSHCPHYAEEGKSLQCWANYGSPRLWKYRPDPMSKMEKIIFFAGFAIIFGLPFIFLIIGLQWFFLALYLLTLTGGFLSMRKLMCAHCINFACPLNQVSLEDRHKFWQRNPIVDHAWQSYMELETNRPGKQ